MNNDKEGSATEFSQFLGTAKVETRNSLFSDGRIIARQQPQQVTYRIPAKQVLWLEQHVQGNKNYAVSKILEYGIARLKEKIVEGDFNIDDLKDL